MTKQDLDSTTGVEKEFPESTPRPWRADHFQYDAANVLGSDGVRIGEFVRRDHQHSPEHDARLAVTAVNSYDSLRNQNAVLREAVESALEWIDAALDYDDVAMDGAAVMSQLRKALEKQ